MTRDKDPTNSCERFVTPFLIHVTMGDTVLWVLVTPLLVLAREGQTESEYERRRTVNEE